jgi:3-hydroxyisobutyrate dehydrogenase
LDEAVATIGFIGLGNMGRGMAARLLEAGHDVRVHNRSVAKAQDLVTSGAKLAMTPGDAAVGADAVFVMVSDDDASREVWLGTEGVTSAAVAPGALAIECSTLSHSWVLELAERLRGKGFRYLDCPVTGLPDAAAAGQLTLLVGADPEDLEAARPLLAPVSSDMLHFGGVGAGTAYKLIVNLMGAVQIAGVAEGMAMAERAGLDLGLVADAIATGQAASPQVVRNARRMVAGDHAVSVTFSGHLRRKDADYGVRLADELGLAAPFGRTALRGLDELVERGLGDQNESSVVEVARRPADS